MKKTTKLIALLMMLVLSVSLLVACSNKQSQELIDAKEALTVESILNGNESKDKVTGDLKLDSKIGEVSIVWGSDNINVITIGGKVTRPEDANVTVKLTANLKFGKESDKKEFTLTVLKVEADTKVLAYSFTGTQGLTTSYTQNTDVDKEFTNTVDDASVNVHLKRAAASSSSTTYKEGLVISGANVPNATNEGYIEFKLTEAVNSVTLDMMYWNSFAVGEVVKITVQVKNTSGDWVEVGDISAKLAGATEMTNVEITGINNQNVRIHVQGDYTKMTGSGNNGARIILDNIKFYK